MIDRRLADTELYGIDLLEARSPINDQPDEETNVLNQTFKRAFSQSWIP